MKKLMIIAAAAMGLAAFGDIESSNVVGYQQKETVTGFNFVIPSFEAVGGDKVNIQNIKIEGASDWADNLQILDEGGATLALYVYATTEQSGFENDGWIAEDFSGLADVTLEPGQGVLVDTSAPAVITFSGEVSTKDTVVNTVSGFNFVGNNTPVNLNVQDIKIEGASDWADNLQILDEGGATLALYVYATSEQSGFENDGWIAEDFSGLAEITIEPGQGILIDTSDSAKVTIPGVDL